MIEKWRIYKRHRVTARNVVPMMTWRPWNPVATKNVEPYTLSAMEKGACRYSPTWRIVKNTPSVIVINKATHAPVRLPVMILWWLQVRVTPDARRTAVFRRGTLNGSRGVIPVGGQVHPSSGVGARLLWKKAQKNAKKNRISEVMKRTMPNRSPFITGVVWCPINVPSRMISRHHWIIVSAIKRRPRITPVKPWP